MFIHHRQIANTVSDNYLLIDACVIYMEIMCRKKTLSCLLSIQYWYDDK